MDAIPPPPFNWPVPKTPWCNRTLYALDVRLWNGGISPNQPARKVRKALKDVLADKAMLERVIERWDA